MLTPLQAPDAREIWLTALCQEACLPREPSAVLSTSFPEPRRQTTMAEG